MQLALPIAGAALGSLLGPGALFLGMTGSSIGWLAGGMLAGSLQTQKVQGPRLADTKLSGSSYGAPIHHVFGHPRVGAQIIWGSDKREIATTTSRRVKGGPKVKSTTYTYEVDLLLKLSANELPGGVVKIFVNGELQWSADSTADYGTIEASSALARRITVYTGAATQLPDPTYEAAVGIGNAPAYRGSLTIMMEGLQLGNAGQIPNLTFEVAQGSTAVVTSQTLADVPMFTTNALVNAAWVDGGYTYWQRNSAGMQNFNVAKLDVFGAYSFLGTYTLSGNDWDSRGHADRAVLMGATVSPNRYALMQELDGSLLKVLMTTSGESPFRYEVVGNQVWLSSGSAIYYFLLEDAYIVGGVTDVQYGAVTRLAAVQFSSMRFDGESTIYCLRAGAAGVRVIEQKDAVTLVTSASFNSPAALSGNAELLFDSEGNLLLLDYTILYRWDGSTWVAEMTVAGGWGASPSASDTAIRVHPVYEGGVLRVAFQTGTGPVTYAYRASWKTFSVTEPTLQSVVTALCARVGITAAQIDVSALSGNVAAFAISPGTTRAALEVLMRAYFFDASSADKLRFIPRGGAPVATIPWDDLAANESMDGEEEPLPLSVRNDMEMPSFITVKSMNVDDDYQDGSQSSSRIASWSVAESLIELPLGLTPAQGQHVADVMARDVQAALTSVGPIKLQQKWAALQPGDVVLIIGRDGSSYRVRFERRDASQAIYSFQGVFDDATVIDGAGITDEDYDSTTVIRSPSVTTLYVLDMPLLRDVDDDLGYYAAVRNLSPAFNGASIFRSTDDVVYDSVGDILETATLGVATTTLGTYTGGNFPDETNVVRVNVGPGVTLSSITWAEALLEQQNAWMIGSELVIARASTYVSDGVWDLSGLSRGRKGTEWAVGTHVANERVALLSFDGMRRITGDASQLNELRYHRAVTYGMDLDSAATVAATNTGVSAKPYAPVDLTVARAGGNVTLAWGRRTRLAENWMLGSTPLGEATEAWEIVRYTSNTFVTVAATYTSSTNSVTFANTDPAVYVDIFQISDRVGRGYRLRATL